MSLAELQPAEEQLRAKVAEEVRVYGKPLPLLAERRLARGWVKRRLTLAHSGRKARVVASLKSPVRGPASAAGRAAGVGKTKPRMPMMQASFSLKKGASGSVKAAGKIPVAVRTKRAARSPLGQINLNVAGPSGSGGVGRMASGPKKAVVDVKGKGREIIF
jgi:hypothetical protein